MKRILFGILFFTFAAAALAKEAAPLAKDPALEARMLKLSKELRCLVCQNETLADSQADLARDLRREVREKMREGMSDAEIKHYLTHRYGDFVLYRPPMKPTTWVLWFGPFLLLFGAAGGLVFFIKRRRRALDETPLTPDEATRIQSLLNKESDRA
ncbi:MAG: cytochrome c-type biogenesis protein [Burkholderiales bacterium]